MGERSSISAIAKVAAAACIALGGVAFAHGGKEHAPPPAVPTPSSPSAEAPAAPAQPVADTEAFRKINEAYARDIRPVFVAKCFDCHSDQTHYPWYYALPLVHGLIDEDVEEGREHLDLSKDFPFAGHHSVEENFEELLEVLEEGAMPPFLYRLMHWGTGLTDEEVTHIRAWVDASRRLLPAAAPSP